MTLSTIAEDDFVGTSQEDEIELLPSSLPQCTSALLLSHWTGSPSGTTLLQSSGSYTTVDTSIDSDASDLWMPPARLNRRGLVLRGPPMVSATTANGSVIRTPRSPRTLPHLKKNLRGRPLTLPHIKQRKICAELDALAVEIQSLETVSTRLRSRHLQLRQKLRSMEAIDKENILGH
ncbi:hypothetical protein C8J57DRAFT_1309061 [Mycena rebaudengoi]|nr:hypothetical protein C8J57DRAFT_1309061 [Mycena rebaudengoi]